MASRIEIALSQRTWGTRHLIHGRRKSWAALPFESSPGKFPQPRLAPKERGRKSFSATSETVPPFQVLARFALRGRAPVLSERRLL